MNLFERLAKGRPAAAEEKIKQPHKEPAQRLLDFLQRWPKTTISSRQMMIYGPRPFRDRKSVITSAEILVRHGWLAPIKTWRQDMKHWQIVRRPIVHPTVAG